MNQTANLLLTPQRRVQDFGWSVPRFLMHEGSRFLRRCELDAAILHLYLPAAVIGGWHPVDVRCCHPRRV